MEIPTQMTGELAPVKEEESPNPKQLEKHFSLLEEEGKTIERIDLDHKLNIDHHIEQ
jgi:hypothetical protein